MNSLLKFLLALSLCLSSSCFASTDKNASTLKNNITQAKNIVWIKGASGVQTAILHRYDSKSGDPYMRLFKAVKGFINFPHFHRTSTLLYVAKGDLHLGFGAKFDKSKAITIHQGGFVKIPAKQTHYEWFEGTTEMVSGGLGDRATIYVEPNGDVAKVQENFEHGKKL